MRGENRKGLGRGPLLTRVRFALAKKNSCSYLYSYSYNTYSLASIHSHTDIHRHTQAHTGTPTHVHTSAVLYSYSFAFGIQRIFEYLQRKLMDKFADISCSRRSQFNKEPKPMACPSFPLPSLPFPSLLSFPRLFLYPSHA